MNNLATIAQGHGYEPICLTAVVEAADASLTRSLLACAGLTMRDITRAKALADIPLPDDEMRRVLLWYCAFMEKKQGFGQADRLGVKPARKKNNRGNRTEFGGGRKQAPKGDW